MLPVQMVMDTLFGPRDTLAAADHPSVTDEIVVSHTCNATCLPEALPCRVTRMLRVLYSSGRNKDQNVFLLHDHGPDTCSVVSCDFDESWYGYEHFLPQSLRSLWNRSKRSVYVTGGPLDALYDFMVCSTFEETPLRLVEFLAHDASLVLCLPFVHTDQHLDWISSLSSVFQSVVWYGRHESSRVVHVCFVKFNGSCCEKPPESKLVARQCIQNTYTGFVHQFVTTYPTHVSAMTSPPHHGVLSPVYSPMSPVYNPTSPPQHGVLSPVYNPVSPC